LKKKVFALLAAAVLLLSATAFAQDEPVRVFDYAGFFTAQEAEALEASIAGFQAATGYDFAILVTDVDHGYDDYQQLSDDFYASNQLGLGMNRTAILYYLDLYGEGYYFISVFGDLKHLMTEGNIQYLLDTVIDNFADGDPIGGFQWMMEFLSQAVTRIGVDNPSWRVFDFAALLADEEVDTLETAIADFRALSGRDLIYVSTYEEMDNNQDGYYMEEFYLSHAFGEGEDHSGAAIYLDLNGGNYYVQNFGDMDTLITQDDLTAIVNRASGLMGDGEILPATLQIIDDYTAYFE